MADIVLKNYKGEDVVYTGVKTILLNTADGGTQEFSEGDGLIDYVNTSTLCKTSISGQYSDLDGVRSVSFLFLETVGSSCFKGCSDLVKAEFHAAKSFGSSAFYLCYALKTLIIRTETMCTLSSSSPDYFFSAIPYIYVPAALVATYKSNSVWSRYADRFRAIEDYPDICG